MSVFSCYCTICCHVQCEPFTNMRARNAQPKTCFDEKLWDTSHGMLICLHIIYVLLKMSSVALRLSVLIRFHRIHATCIKFSTFFPYGTRTEFRIFHPFTVVLVPFMGCWIFVAQFSTPPCSEVPLASFRFLHQYERISQTMWSSPLGRRLRWMTGYDIFQPTTIAHIERQPNFMETKFPKKFCSIKIVLVSIWFACTLCMLSDECNFRQFEFCCQKTWQRLVNMMKYVNVCYVAQPLLGIGGVSKVASC